MMTKQEYIKKESEKYYGFKTVDPFAFDDGLAKGLEIAEGFAEWIFVRLDKEINCAELLNIFLTENEKNNVDKNS